MGSTPVHHPILPGATLGVLGGGQLGRMFVHAAQQLGYSVAVLDPDPHSPAGRVSHHHVRSGYTDLAGLDELSGLCAAVTTEFENVPAQALERLARQRTVSPSAAAVAVAQDRAAEKAHFVRCGVACAPHALISSEAELAAVPQALLPGILKTARLGYDGKGQASVATRGALSDAWHALKQVPCVLEQRLPLEFECSVVLARGADGAMVQLPPQRNLHRGGILAVTEVHEGCIPEAVAAQAVQGARAIAQGLDYVGVLCVEFFVLAGGTLVVNEIAPRPHNSGHWSLDGADVSQFELQVRTLAGLPLTPPRQHSPALMLNLLGELWFGYGHGHGNGNGSGSGSQAQEPDWASVLALPGAHLHLYGKTEARPGRKMGHLTITGATPGAVRKVALQAAAKLGIAPWAESTGA